MEQTPFELTPKQKGILSTLSRATGKPIPALLDEALEALQERSTHEHGTGEDHETAPPVAPPQEASKPLWAVFADAFKDVPEEELARLPVDGAAQHDHYIYGWPKREL